MPDPGAGPIRDLDGIAPERGVAKPDPLLVIDGLCRRFGGLAAVDVDHLEIQRRAITALIGPNGAGKTTLFNLLSGFDRPHRGRWRFEGQEIGGTSAWKLAREGMVRTFQLTRVLPRLTVRENLMLAASGQRGERLWAALWPSWRAQEREVGARADAVMERFDLTHMSGEFAATLSGGQRKLLEMARALMAEPTLVLLDEPMAGVNPALKESLLQHMVSLRDEGVTVLFVEHDMDAVMGISDWVVCMAEGEIIAEGRPDDIVTNPAVIDAYLGGHHGEMPAGARGGG